MITVSQIGIIGLGLIGGSLGLALKKYLPEIKISGMDRENKHLEFALNQGIIDRRLTEDNLDQQEIVFIAVPTRSVIPVIERIYSNLDRQTIITDLASTKEYLYREIANKFPGLRYFGGHPLAGREISGPRGALADLFKDKKYILVSEKNLAEIDRTGKTDLTVLREIIQSIGAEVIELTPENHDRILAFTSHLPQLIATLLCEQLSLMEERDFSEITATELIGQGFLDMTRIAASNPVMWLDIFQSNKKNLLKMSNELLKRIERFQKLLISGDEEGIQELFNRGRKQRLSLERGRNDGLKD